MASGASIIPFEWKHMFCHTSIQAIFHSIGSIFAVGLGTNINAPSGLFGRRCSHCGLKLELLPLHTLVLVGLHLSRSGCKGENLFGILACLLCLLKYGANPLLKAELSVQALLGDEEVNGCSHEELDPAELAEKVADSLVSMWSKRVSTGWGVFCKVLRSSQATWRVQPSRRRPTSEEMEYKTRFNTFGHSEDKTSTNKEESNCQYLPVKCPDFTDHTNYFGGNNILAPLWAAVQTELLTYRRLKEGDEWI